MSATLQRPPSRSHLRTQPYFATMPAERMAVVETVGNPEEVGKEAIQALYGAVYTLKFAQKKAGRDFKVKPLRARWFNWQAESPSALRGIWGLPVPPLTREVPQKVSGRTVRVETWDYGTVAEILHLGPYSAERPTIERLLAFIHDQGYEVAGTHEEEYLSRPESRVPKTLIRYPVKKSVSR